MLQLKDFIEGIIQCLHRKNLVEEPSDVFSTSIEHKLRTCSMGQCHF